MGHYDSAYERDEDEANERRRVRLRERYVALAALSPKEKRERALRAIIGQLGPDAPLVLLLMGVSEEEAFRVY